MNGKVLLTTKDKVVDWNFALQASESEQQKLRRRRPSLKCTAVGSTSSPNWLKWHEIMNPDLEIPNGVHKSATFPG